MAYTSEKEPIICSFCTKPFIPKQAKTAKQRITCYGWQCEQRKELEHARRTVERNRANRMAEAAAEAKL